MNIISSEGFEGLFSNVSPTDSQSYRVIAFRRVKNKVGVGARGKKLGYIIYTFENISYYPRNSVFFSNDCKASKFGWSRLWFIRAKLLRVTCKKVVHYLMIFTRIFKTILLEDLSILSSHFLTLKKI